MITDRPGPAELALHLVIVVAVMIVTPAPLRRSRVLLGSSGDHRILFAPSE